MSPCPHQRLRSGHRSRSELGHKRKSLARVQGPSIASDFGQRVLCVNANQSFILECHERRYRSSCRRPDLSQRLDGLPAEIFNLERFNQSRNGLCCRWSKPAQSLCCILLGKGIAGLKLCFQARNGDVQRQRSDTDTVIQALPDACVFIIPFEREVYRCREGFRALSGLHPVGTSVAFASLLPGDRAAPARN